MTELGALEPQAAATAEPKSARFLVKLALSLVLAALFTWLAVRGGVPVIPPRESFDHVAWWTVGAYAGLFLVTHVFRASRWRFLIRPVREIPFREVIALNWIGFFAIFAFPLRLGEFARPAVTKIRFGVPISVGLGTVAIERVIDGLITSLCVAWALLALPRVASRDALTRALPFYGVLAVCVFSSALVLLGVFVWRRPWVEGLIRLTVHRASPRLGHFVAEKVGSMADGLGLLRQPQLLAQFLLESLAYWGTNAFGMWLLAWGCGLPVHPGHAVAIMGILAIGILLPSGPGLFGNFQLFVSTALKMYVATEIVGTQGAVYVFLMYAVQTVLITLCGLIPLYAMNIPLPALIKVTPGSQTA